jgi:hypothetical protein
MRSANRSGPSLRFIFRMFTSSFEYFESLCTSFSKIDMAFSTSALTFAFLGMGAGGISRSFASK